MSAELDECLFELMACNDETCGTPQFVLIEGKKKRAIIEDMTTEEMLVAGGNAESGGFRAKCRKADFASQPEQGDVIKKGTTGRELSILSVIERNGVEYQITAGDPSSEI
jgi:hypothetical protein